MNGEVDVLSGRGKTPKIGYDPPILKKFVHIRSQLLQLVKFMIP